MNDILKMLISIRFEHILRTKINRAARIILKFIQCYIYSRTRLKVIS